MQVYFALPEAATVEITLYDVLGRKVEHLVDGRLPAGFHRAAVEASGLPNGVYVYHMRARGAEGGSFAGTGKLVVAR